MLWKVKNPKEYRKRFAFFPVKINDTWILWKRYERTGWYYDPAMDDMIRDTRYPTGDGFVQMRKIEGY